MFTNKSLTRTSANNYNNDNVKFSVPRYWTETLIDLGRKGWEGCGFTPKSTIILYILYSIYNTYILVYHGCWIISFCPNAIRRLYYYILYLCKQFLTLPYHIKCAYTDTQAQTHARILIFRKLNIGTNSTHHMTIFYCYNVIVILSISMLIGHHLSYRL